MNVHIFLDRDFAGRAAWSPGRPWWSQGQGAQAHSTHTHHNFDFCVTDTHVHATEFVTDTHIRAHRNLVTATAHASSISDQELVNRCEFARRYHGTNGGVRTGVLTGVWPGGLPPLGGEGLRPPPPLGTRYSCAWYNSTRYRGATVQGAWHKGTMAQWYKAQWYKVQGTRYNGTS